MYFFSVSCYPEQYYKYLLYNKFFINFLAVVFIFNFLNLINSFFDLNKTKNKQKLHQLFVFSVDQNSCIQNLKKKTLGTGILKSTSHYA
jgi:hypothetical protein